MTDTKPKAATAKPVPKNVELKLKAVPAQKPEDMKVKKQKVDVSIQAARQPTASSPKKQMAKTGKKNTYYINKPVAGLQEWSLFPGQLQPSITQVSLQNATYPKPAL